MTATQLVPGDVLAALEANRFELHHLADGLASVERQLHGTDDKGGVQEEYTSFVDNFEIGLWNAHVNDGAKLPAKDLRAQLAHRAMPPELYGKFFALKRSRERILSRIGTLKAEIEAQRSILSALKEGLV